MCFAAHLLVGTFIVAFVVRWKFESDGCDDLEIFKLNRPNHMSISEN